MLLAAFVAKLAGFAAVGIVGQAAVDALAQAIGGATNWIMEALEITQDVFDGVVQFLQSFLFEPLDRLTEQVCRLVRFCP